MAEQDDPEITENKSTENLASEFGSRVIRRVFIQVPSTIFAIVIGAFAGGFIGLTSGPFAPLFSLLGAILLGTPVAIWEYKIKDKGGSSWDVK